MFNNMQSEADLLQAAKELQELQKFELQQNGAHTPHHRRFPPTCLRLVKGVEGNLRCVDCDATNPQWATVSYGALLCIDCSGSHRQLGVQISVVRSVSMDSWSYSEVVSMLEGGNKQLNDFFTRHGLPSSHFVENDNGSLDDSSSSQIPRNRYKTNAAMFYRDNLAQHVSRVKDSGDYKGRESFRKQPKKSKKGKKRSTVGKSNRNTASVSCAAECSINASGGADTNNAVGA